MYILLTNDDGIDSEGLLALRKALSRVGEVAVIAPNHNWSAAGHTRTLDRPLRATKVPLLDGDWGFVTDGAPSDCVSLGMLGLLERRPELVVAGINKGANLGEDVYYSGTVAAAAEAVIFGLPGLAVSLADRNRWDFTYAAEFTARLVQLLKQHRLPNPFLLNINIPNLPKEQIRGVEITRLGKRIYRDVLVERQDPYGRTYYWIGGEEPSGLMEEGTDIKALADHKISITPIHLDLTNHALIEKLKGWKLAAG